MDMTEKKLIGERKFHGRLLQIDVDTVLLPNGNISTREVAQHCDGVGILPITKEGDVLLVRQYRYCFGRVLLEIPAGKMDVAGESPLESAERELKEETGCTAGEILELGSALPSPGCFTEVLHLFLAKDLDIGESSPDEDEFLELVRMPFSQAVQMAMDGEIEDAKSVIAILKAARLLGSETN